jgi:hypothetical protein
MAATCGSAPTRTDIAYLINSAKVQRALAYTPSYGKDADAMPGVLQSEEVKRKQ